MGDAPENVKLTVATDEADREQEDKITINDEESQVNKDSIGDVTAGDDQLESTELKSTEQPVVGQDAALRFCVAVGKAAFRYGSPGTNVDRFLERLLEERFGYRGIFLSSQSELLCSLEEPQPPESEFCQVEHWGDNNMGGMHPAVMVRITKGFDLSKLSLLAELVDDVFEKKNTLHESFQRLEVIDKSPNPYGRFLQFLGYIFVGAGLAMVLGGSWWDVALGSFLGAVCYAVVLALPIGGPRYARWVDLVAAFLCSAIATAARSFVPELNVTLITLSAVGILLPGFSISMGVAEIVQNRIISGLATFFQGMITLLWLVIGTWLGTTLVSSMIPLPEYLEGSREPVPPAWQGLFIPMLCLSLGIGFQISPRDFVWSFCHMLATCGASFAFSKLTNRNLGVFLSTLVLVVLANAWSIRFHRPNSILLVPAIVLQVSGSIGFQGALKLAAGDVSVGAEQFLQMFVVALLIIAGLLAGNTILEPKATL